jgi:hypothetical protein
MEDNVTTIPPEAAVHPLSLEEYNELKDFITTLGARLPDSKLGYVWNTYNQLRGVQEKQPCGCQSAAGHWVTSINYLKQWLESKSI